jgi:ferrous-iron efflux pump FieF
MFLAYESVVRLARPVELESEAVGIAVMGLSIAASYLLVRYLRRVARETNSLALAADSLHFATDVLANGGVLALLFVVRVTDMPILDPIVSLAISVYIGYTAAGVMRDAIDQLMDRALPDEVCDRVRAIVDAHPEVAGVHDLKTRSSGSRSFIEMHLEIDGSRSLEDAHRAAVDVLRQVERAIPNSKVFVHMDPVKRVEGQGPGGRAGREEVPSLTPDP